MDRLRRPSSFAIVGLEDARRLTGVDAAELKASPQVQQLMRVLPDGRREPALRLPRALLIDAES
jgi:hypothetical protein